MMTKREAVKLFDGNQSALARALGIHHQAVCAWPWDKPIPRLREMQLRYEVIPSRDAQVETGA